MREGHNRRQDVRDCEGIRTRRSGHADPPIKMQKIWLNEVEAYTGIAAVNAYIGAAQLSDDRGMEYGGAHVIEDLVAGKPVEVRALAYGTDCYPRKEIETTIAIEDLNQAIMINPRNAYQRYNVATNSTDRTLYTYMGMLLPHYGNATYSGAGELSPLCNDPLFETIGIGTRIFLCGAKGYIIGEGTQHEPINNFGTLMVKGNLKEMNTEFLRAAIFHKYGTTLYVSIGIPIPILNEGMALRTTVSDEVFKPMKQIKELPLVKDVMISEEEVITIKEDATIEEAANVIMKGQFTHLPVISDDEKLVGIVTVRTSLSSF